MCHRSYIPGQKNCGKRLTIIHSLNRGEVEKPLRVGLVLGTSWATKEWPQEKWYSLIKSLQYRANFVCLGGPKEATQYKPLMDSLAAEGIDQDYAEYARKDDTSRGRCLN